MRLLVNTVLVVITASCSGKKAETRQAEQPTEVSGGFGLTMQCSVLNRDMEDAASSSIGCLVYNDDGSRFTGSIAGTTAEIVTSSGGVITASQIVSDASAGSYSFGVEVANLKPSDAATIRISANFDNSPRTLVASLKGRLATLCDEDTSLYVDKNADEKNILCTKDQPCSSINRALKVLPDIINCKMTIEIRGTEFVESFVINAKQMQNNGLIRFEGISSEDGKVPIIKQPSNINAHISFVGLENASFTSASAVIIKNLELQGAGISQGIRGVVARSSNVGLESVEFSQYETAIWLAESSTIGLKNITINNSRRGLLASSNTRNIKLAGEINVTGSPTTSSLAATRSDSPAFQILGANLIVALEQLSLKIKNFSQGLNLANATFNLHPGHQIEIENVGYGITLENAKINLVDPTENFPGVNPLSISIKDFTNVGLNLTNAIISDGTMDSGVKPMIKISSSANFETRLVHAINSSSVILVNSILDFCFPTPAQVAATPWYNSTNNLAFYAITVYSQSEAIFDWSQSPFNKSNECTPTDVSLFVQTYKYRFLAPSLGAGICPTGYEKASDNVCYGSMGYVRYRSANKFFGVLEGDSRVDNLPTP